jgi:predicted aspartyl protease
VHVTIEGPDGGNALTDVPAQIDTAADLSVVPANLLEALRLVQLDSIAILGFGGVVRRLATYAVRLRLRGREPVSIEVVSSIEEPFVLLGRDVLNRYRLLLDGPRGFLEID